MVGCVIDSIRNIFKGRFFLFMKLYDEFYFEITLTGKKTDITRFISFVKAGGLDDFFEPSDDYINPDDNYDSADGDTECELVFSNDDWGIEIDELDTDELLDVLCRAAKPLHIRGTLYDTDDGEYSFVSEAGAGYYVKSSLTEFNDELDAKRDEEEYGEE